MRYPQLESEEGPEGAVPRILTPTELLAFLEDATEQELVSLCERKNWTL